jgi:hypothetical protein
VAINIDKILNDVAKRASKVKCPDYLTKKIMADIDDGYKTYRRKKKPDFVSIGDLMKKYTGGDRGAFKKERT